MDRFFLCLPHRAGDWSLRAPSEREASYGDEND